MKKYVCTVCGYIAEGEIPAQCPDCKAPASAFVEKTGNTYVTEHVVGIGKAEGVPQEIVDGLRANFEGDGHEFERKAEVLPQPRETDGQSYAVLAARNAHQNAVAGGQHLVLLDGFAHQAAEPLHRFRVAHDRLTLSTRLTMSLMEASLVRPET